MNKRLNIRKRANQVIPNSILPLKQKIKKYVAAKKHCRYIWGMEDTAKNIVQLTREQMGYSQEEFAEIFRVRQATVSRWESTLPAFLPPKTIYAMKGLLADQENKI